MQYEQRDIFCDFMVEADLLKLSICQKNVNLDESQSMSVLGLCTILVRRFRSLSCLYVQYDLLFCRQTMPGRISCTENSVEDHLGEH